MRSPARLETSVPPDIADRFRAVAAKHDRSMTAHLRHLIRGAVSTNDSGDPAKVPAAQDGHVDALDAE